MYRNDLDRNATLPCRNGDTCYFFRTGHCHFYHGPPLEDTASSSQGAPAGYGRGYICNRNPMLIGPPSNQAPVYTNQPRPVMNMMHHPYSNSFDHTQSDMQPTPQLGRYTRRRPSRFGPRSNASSSASSPSNSSNLKRKGSLLHKNPKAAKLDYKEDRQLLEIEAFQCPISMEEMQDPVVAADGHSYERLCIEQWLRKQDRSPLNNTRLSSKRLTPNHTLRKAIQEWSSLKLLLSPTESELK